MSSAAQYSATKPIRRLPEAVTLLSETTHESVVEKYFAIWAVLMPLATFVLTDRIPGTVPAYLLAFASPIFCLRRKYFSALVCFVFAWILFALASQLGLIYTGTRAHMGLYLVNSLDRSPVFRSELFTQSLYLFACVLIFLYIKTHYRPRMMRYVFWGAWFFAIYALYDWTFQLATGMSGDFLNNRTFDQVGGEARPSSLSQYLSEGHSRFIRLKGMTEEPSRYGTVVVLYISLAIAHGRKWLTNLLLITLLLSTSVSGLLAMGVLTVALLSRNSKLIPKRVVVGILGLVVVGLTLAAFALPELFNEVIVSRITGEHQSAQNRFGRITEPLSVFMELPWINKLFGVGFGTCLVSGANMILINCGLVGLAIAIAFVAFPIIKLRHSDEDVGIYAALIVISFMYAFIEPGIYVAVTWMILGIAYARVFQLTRQSASVPSVKDLNRTAIQ